MKRKINISNQDFIKILSLVLVVIVLSSHDLYIKMETYFLQPYQEASLNLYNGTFEKSENIITRDRMIDASIVAHGERKAIDESQWKDKDSTITQLSFNTGEAGTYVVGVSTKARNIELSAEDFNEYLKHDGVLDMLEQRTRNNQLGVDAVESYQKHIKAIYQVGDVKTDDWQTVLGYPIEFIPEINPYEKFTGDELPVKLLLNNKPLPNQLVYGNYIKNPNGHSHGNQTHEHNGISHTHDDSSDENHTHTEGQQMRTNEQGVVMLQLPEDGIYYLRTIHMVQDTMDNSLTHHSKWATLTFEVTHEHDLDSHNHAVNNGIGLPNWVFILGSFVILGLLFLFFRKKV